MISWSFKTDYLGDYRDKHTSTCKVCLKDDFATYQVTQEYFAAYGLSLAPTKRVIYKNCSACSFRSKMRKLDVQLIDNQDLFTLSEIDQLYPKKLKLRYIWGWIVIAALAGLIAYIALTW